MSDILETLRRMGDAIELPTLVDEITKAEETLAYYRFRKYGITAQDFAVMYLSQDGLCGICGVPMTNPYVDHCHQTGKVRGLLCHHCNTGLGNFRDCPEFLLNAIQYLAKGTK